jgi:hypothetical protein
VFMGAREDYAASEQTSKRRILHFTVRDRMYYFGFGWNDFDSGRLARIGQWDHVAWRYDGETGKAAIVVNGVVACEKLLDGYDDADDETIQVGGEVGSEWAGPFKGCIVAAAVFGRALSVDELDDLAHATLPEEHTDALSAAQDTEVALVQSIFAAPAELRSLEEVMEVRQKGARHRPCGSVDGIESGSASSAGQLTLYDVLVKKGGIVLKETQVVRVVEGTGMVVPTTQVTRVGTYWSKAAHLISKAERSKVDFHLRALSSLQALNCVDLRGTAVTGDMTELQLAVPSLNECCLFKTAVVNVPSPTCEYGSRC